MEIHWNQQVFTQLPSHTNWYRSHRLLWARRKKQFTHNNENGTVGFDTPALYLLCFDALKSIYISTLPQRTRKGTHLTLPFSVYWRIKTMQSYTKICFPYWPSTIFPRQVLMKEEAGMALLWRDLEAHSVAGFAHRLQLELHPQLFIISSDHVGDTFWRQVDQASFFVR